MSSEVVTNDSDTMAGAARPRRRVPWWAVAAAVVLVLAAGAALTFGRPRAASGPVGTFREKSALLWSSISGDASVADLEEAPAGAVGHAVFLSVCDGSKRAFVWHGTGATLSEAYASAESAAAAGMEEAGSGEPRWIRADVVRLTEEVDGDGLSELLQESRQGYFRYGVAFDEDFGTALLESELNALSIFDHSVGNIDFGRLNTYLIRHGGSALESLPQTYTLFQSTGFLCDEDNATLPLATDQENYGHRQVVELDDAYAAWLIDEGVSYLSAQMKDDGSFDYGIYAGSGSAVSGYNVLRHAGAVWTMILQHRIEPDPVLARDITCAIRYMLGEVVYADNDVAYLLDSTSNELKLGGCGLAVITLADYMDAFDSEEYLGVCRALGRGILSMLDQDTGKYYHVFNVDFTPKEEFRTVYYDGEATFALCRLYDLTGDQLWLDAARSTVANFIDGHYEQYRDHWIAYSMNEITRHYPDNEEFARFAMLNAQENLKTIRTNDTTWASDLELLMASFEAFDRLPKDSPALEVLDAEDFIDTIFYRARYQLTGFLYPEYAMYLDEPRRVLGAFMVRHDDFRVRIDDVGHNLGGYYLYWKNYDRLLSYRESSA